MPDKLMYRIIIIFLTTGTLAAQEKIYLYPSSMKVTNPGYEKDKEPPYILWFKPPSGSGDGPAILICPGGGYTVLADQHEGLEVAKFFTENGYHAFVLHYRINNYDHQGHRHPDQYNDVTTAMRTIKSRAKEWKFDPERLGIIGFSAGGHLASMCATMELPADKKSKDGLKQWSSRPAFAVLIYPVIDLSAGGAIKYCSEMLLGRNPAKTMIDSLSTHRRVTATTPPTFIAFANDDEMVVPEHGIKFYQALRENKIPASLHIFDHGAHGFGLGKEDPVLNTWTTLCVEWLAQMGYRRPK